MSDLSFSYSALSTALRCNRLYQHLYIDKLKPEEPESLALHFGTALHCGINSVIEGDSYSSFSAYWDSVESTAFEKARYDWSELGGMGLVFLERFNRLHAKNFKKHTAEKRLYGLLPGGVRVEGTPDFIGEYRGLMTVVDFKTSGSAYPSGKIEASDQLMLYAYLTQQALGTTIEQLAYIVFIKAKEPRIQVQTLELNQEALKRRIDNIEVQCRKLSLSGNFPQNFNACFDYGKRCAFWDKCQKGE